MALKLELESLGGLEGYLRVRNIVLFRDSPGQVSNFKNPQNQPATQLQVDFEVYVSEEARAAGKNPIGGVHTFQVAADKLFDDELSAKVYTLAKQHYLLEKAQDV